MRTFYKILSILGIVKSLSKGPDAYVKNAIRRRQKSLGCGSDAQAPQVTPRAKAPLAHGLGSLFFDGNAAAAGTYLATLTVGDFKTSKKLTLAK